MKGRDKSMRSSSYLQRGAVVLTAPVLAFGVLTAAWKHSVMVLAFTAGWCAFVWAGYGLLRALFKMRRSSWLQTKKAGR